MLPTQENELISQVGPGTPGGNLMRAYWLPMAFVAKRDESEAVAALRGDS